MNNLSCNVTTCVYNSQNLCSKESIKIAGKNTITANFTSCEDFRRKTGELTSSVKSANITIGGDYALSEIQTECSTFVSKIYK